jgi:hypothetical protein
MSGVKYTRFELEQEQRARQMALGDLRRQTSVIRETKNRIQDVLSSLPDGVKECFATETDQAGIWLRRNLQAGDSASSSSTLRAKAEECRQMADEGARIFEDLVAIVEHRRDERAREILGQGTALHIHLDGEKELIDKWRPGYHSSLSEKINALFSEIDKGNFKSTEQQLPSLQQEIDRVAAKATTLEHQDQERRYVLGALQEVCAEMGWKVVHVPTLEEPEKPGSDLIFKVNTYTSGKMEFRLSLEGITVDSPVTHVGRVCHHDFGNVSDKLRNLGVKTAFEQVDPPADEPKLVAKGALPQPVSGKTRAMNR